MKTDVDVVIVGAGHNGLVCAALLAKHGLRVTVLEARHLVGGACVTEELWPGFKISRASYVCGLFRPIVLKELSLKLPLLPRRPSSFTPMNDSGGGLILGWGDHRRDQEEIARYSTKDAARYPKYEQIVSRLAQLIDPLLDIDMGGDSLGAEKTIAIARALAGFATSGKDAIAMTSMLLGSARNQLASWFESEPLRSTLATDALIGTFAGPSSSGTGYVLVHHMMGGGTWSYVRGGMGTISEMLKTKAEQHGVRFLLNSRVAGIEPSEDGKGGVVVLADGSTIRYSKAIVSNLNPLSTTNLIQNPNGNKDESGVDSFTSAVKTIDFRSPVVKINLALDSLPVFKRTSPSSSGQQQRPGPEHMGTIHIGASTLDDLDDSFLSAQRLELPVKPMIEMTIPSVVDPTLAPEGKHVCSLFVQHVPPSIPPQTWTSLKSSFVDRVLGLVNDVSPGFSQRILHMEVLTPPDLERIFGLTGGNIFHGAMTPDRLLFGRPVHSYFHPSVKSSYATPWKGVFLCSAGTHPGGGVMGACGRNAAVTILRRLARP